MDLRASVLRLLREVPQLDRADLDHGSFEIDSVELLQIIVRLEQQFSLNLGDLDIEPQDLRSVDGIVAVLERHGAGSPPQGT